MWGKGRGAVVYILVALGIAAALLRPGAGLSAVTVPLHPDLRTAPLPTSTVGQHSFQIERSGGTTHFRFANGLQNGGVGPFEVTPAALPASDDCNNNGNFDDDVAMNQRIFQDDGNGVFDRAVDTGTTLHPAGCMAFHEDHQHYHVDQMSLYRLISETTGAITETSTKVTFCLVDNVRFDASLPGSPTSPYYQSCGLSDQGISIGWHDVYTSGLPGQSFDVTDMPAGNYCLRSRIDPNNRFVETDETNNVAEQRYYIDPSTTPPQATPLVGPCTVPSGPPPSNDPFSQPASIDIGSTVGTNVDATKEAGEPSHGDDDGGSSVWYEWTPSAPLTVSLHTCGSTLDTLLAVYTGSAVDSLAAVASNDDAFAVCPGTMQSAVSFDATPGATYLIAVDGYGGTTGAFTLTLGGPRLSISDIKRREGDAGRMAFRFTVSLQIPASTPVTVDYATQDAGAVAGEDYARKTGTLTFAPGEMTKDVTIQVFGDRTHENRERFHVVLNEAVGAALTDGLGTGTIRNDDPAPTRR